MKVNKLRMLASQKGFTLIELMIVIAIIGILAAVAIPNFIEYKNKSYCTATVNDVGAIGGALADYFANPANITVTTNYTPGGAGARPRINVGNTATGYNANTLLLSASTQNGAAAGVGAAGAAGAEQSGPNYIIFAVEGAGNCPTKITSADFHWIDPQATYVGAANQVPRTGIPVAYFKTL